MVIFLLNQRNHAARLSTDTLRSAAAALALQVGGTAALDDDAGCAFRPNEVLLSDIQCAALIACIDEHYLNHPADDRRIALSKDELVAAVGDAATLKGMEAAFGGPTSYDTVRTRRVVGGGLSAWAASTCRSIRTFRGVRCRSRSTAMTSTRVVTLSLRPITGLLCPHAERARSPSTTNGVSTGSLVSFVALATACSCATQRKKWRRRRRRRQRWWWRTWHWMRWWRAKTSSLRTSLYR